MLGIGLAVAVSALLGLVGWGGELASQTAGAASGAAPLLIDGSRQRSARGRRQDLMSLSLGRQTRPKLLVASLFGFALLVADSGIGFAIVRATRFAVTVAGGDPTKWVSANDALQVVVVLPLVLVATLLLGLAAGHRIGEQRKRWICFGVAISAVVRILHLTVLGPVPGYRTPVLIAGGLLTVAALTGVALLGAWWA